MKTIDLKPVRCGCGGEAKIETDHDTIQPVAPIDWKRVVCTKCNIRTPWRKTEAEAIEAWNKSMGERTAKVIKHKYWLGVSLNVVGEQTIGYEWLCENCKKKVLDGDDYCSHCGARLEWNE